MLLDTAAQNKSLDNDYGATRGSNAPASHQLALFAGDPSLDGVELASAGGYARVTIANNGTSWPAAAAGQKTGPGVTFPTSTGAWSDVATHWVLIGSDGNRWDSGALAEEIDITAAGVTKKVTPTIYYGTRL